MITEFKIMKSIIGYLHIKKKNPIFSVKFYCQKNSTTHFTPIIHRVFPQEILELTLDQLNVLYSTIFAAINNQACSITKQSRLFSYWQELVKDNWTYLTLYQQQTPLNRTRSVATEPHTWGTFRELVRGKRFRIQVLGRVLYHLHSQRAFMVRQS